MDDEIITYLRELNPDAVVDISAGTLLKALHATYVMSNVLMQFNILAAETRSVVGPDAPVYLERDDVIIIIEEANEIYGAIGE